MNIHTKWAFDYKDYGYLRKTEFIFTKQETCIMCREEHGRGFNVNNTTPLEKAKKEQGDFVGFVCLDCMTKMLNQLDYQLEDKKELGFFDLGLPKKYAQFYMRYRQGKMSDIYFQQQYDEFSQFIYPELLESIENMVDLDLEYGEKVSLGSEWKGFWMGATGDDTNILFSWLRTAIQHGKSNLIAHFKRNNGKRPVASVREAQTIVDKFYDKIIAEKKFKR